MIININQLLLYEDNPRLNRSFSEQESIANMISDQGYRLVVLAKSIVGEGLNPLEKIGVFPSRDYEGYYVVGEGNRRVCALKLLLDPSLCKDIDDNTYNAFVSLSPLFKGNQEIEVEVFDDFASMKTWVENIHMGEQNGKGIVRWNAQQKQRFEQRTKGKNLFADFFDMVVSAGVLSREEVNAVTVTNWQRVIIKRYYEFLCLKLDNDSLVFEEKDKDTFALRMREIQRSLKGKSVDVVYNKEKVNSFYDDICMGLYGCNYDEYLIKSAVGSSINKCSFSNNGLNGNDDNSESENSKNVSASKPDKGLFNSENENRAKSTAKQPRDPYGARKTVIPPGFSQRSSCTKINKIIYELRKLPVDDYPNACAALLRLLFELSAKNYLKAVGMNGEASQDFAAAVTGAATELRKRKAIADGAHSKLMKDVDQMRLMFNEDMHDSSSFPTTEGLKGWFTAHHIFIEECLKEGKR